MCICHVVFTHRFPCSTLNTHARQMVRLVNFPIIHPHAHPCAHPSRILQLTQGSSPCPRIHLTFFPGALLPARHTSVHPSLMHLMPMRSHAWVTWACTLPTPSIHVLCVALGHLAFVQLCPSCDLPTRFSILTLQVSVNGHGWPLAVVPTHGPDILPHSKKFVTFNNIISANSITKTKCRKVGWVNF